MKLTARIIATPSVFGESPTTVSPFCGRADREIAWNDETKRMLVTLENNTLSGIFVQRQEKQISTGPKDALSDMMFRIVFGMFPVGCSVQGGSDKLRA